MATYPQQHVPIAIYSPQANKTFFCYGGTTAREGKGKQELLHMVSYFDHATGKVPRPTILLNKQTDDAHDNPTISLDAAGYVWIFSSSHGTSRPSYIHRSKRPYSVDEFERVLETNFSYTQPWFIPGQGFLFLHTRYADGRNLYWMTSPDGRDWSEPHKLAKIEMGDYQISWRHGRARGHRLRLPSHSRVGLNARANLYYLETSDFGRTWHNSAGKPVATPLTNVPNAALVYDSRKDGLLVYLKDLNFDAQGHPVILFLTSKGFEPGPENGPRAMADRPLDRQGMGPPPLYHLRQQLRPRLALYRAGRHLAHHRSDRSRPAALQSGRRNGDVDQHRPGRNLEARQATHPQQPAQPHLRPPPAQRPPGLLRPLGRRQRPPALRVLPLLHQPARRPRLAPAAVNDCGLRHPRTSLVAGRGLPDALKDSYPSTAPLTLGKASPGSWASTVQLTHNWAR